MNFSIVKKGYDPEEVEAYVEDMEAKYLRLQAQNSELEQKLATAKRLIRRFSDTENALKQNIADSKRAAAYMISDARDRSADLLEDARESCGEIISELDMEIARRMETVELMKAEVTSFKEALFSLYSTHIEMIDTIADSAENFDFEPDYSKIANAVDSFEEKGEPECAVPEFVEYPDESIFAEIEETEPVSEDFIIDSEDEESFEDEEIVFETEVDEAAGDEIFEEAAEVEDGEFSELYLEGDNTVFEDNGEDILFGFDEMMPEEAVAFEDDEPIIFDIPEIKNVESEDISESDYFKFLSDFINSDEGEL